VSIAWDRTRLNRNRKPLNEASRIGLGYDNPTHNSTCWRINHRISETANYPTFESLTFQSPPNSRLNRLNLLFATNQKTKVSTPGITAQLWPLRHGRLRAMAANIVLQLPSKWSISQHTFSWVLVATPPHPLPTLKAFSNPLASRRTMSGWTSWSLSSRARIWQRYENGSRIARLLLEKNESWQSGASWLLRVPRSLHRFRQVALVEALRLRLVVPVVLLLRRRPKPRRRRKKRRRSRTRIWASVCSTKQLEHWIFTENEVFFPALRTKTVASEWPGRWRCLLGLKAIFTALISQGK